MVAWYWIPLSLLMWVVFTRAASFVAVWRSGNRLFEDELAKAREHKKVMNLLDNPGFETSTEFIGLDQVTARAAELGSTPTPYDKPYFTIGGQIPGTPDEDLPPWMVHLNDAELEYWNAENDNHYVAQGYPPLPQVVGVHAHKIGERCNNDCQVCQGLDEMVAAYGSTGASPGGVSFDREGEFVPSEKAKKRWWQR